MAYHELATSQHAAVKHRETFVRDKNMGIVNQVSVLLIIEKRIRKLECKGCGTYQVYSHFH